MSENVKSKWMDNYKHITHADIPIIHESAYFAYSHPMGGVCQYRMWLTLLYWPTMELKDELLQPLFLTIDKAKGYYLVTVNIHQLFPCSL